MHLLDTDICICLIRDTPPQVARRLQEKSVLGVAISTVTLGELCYGVEKSLRREKNRAALEAFLAPLEVLPFDDAAARKLGSLRADLERQGRQIGAFDSMIAAHALATHSILVTNNEREFSRVKGLRIENWAK